MISDSLGFYSPFLTAEQKAALDRIEEGLRERSQEKTESGVAEFLELAFELTRDALLEQWEAVDLATFESLRDDEEQEGADAFRSLLWNDRELSPFGALLLDRERSRAAGTLTVDELKDYLAASVDFYEELRPLSASGEIASPGLTWLEPAPAPSLEPPADDDESVEESGPWARSGAALAPPENDGSGDEDDSEELVADSQMPHDDDELPEETSAELLFPEDDLAWGAVETTDGGSAAEKLGDDGVPAAGETSDSESVAEETPEDAPAVEVVVAIVADEPRALPRPSAPPQVPQAWTGTTEVGEETLEMSAAPLSPLEQKNQLIVKKKYLGYGKNADGVMGYCGKLTLSRFDDQLVSAHLACSNPLLFLSTSTPHGREPVVTYWMPPAAFPQPGGHLTIRAGEQMKVLSVGSLFPQSRTDYMSKVQVVLLLLASSLLGLTYFCLVYALSAGEIVEQAQQIFPEAFAAAQAGSTAVSFRAEGVGLFQLEVVPASESLQLIWAVLIWLCPLLATKFFRHLSRSRQRELGGVLAGSLLLPSIGLLGFWHLQKSAFPAFEHPDFAPLDLRYFLAWSVPLNLAVGLYLFLSVHGVWDRKVPPGLRLLLPVGLTGLYAVVAFMLIFGRSWTS